MIALRFALITVLALMAGYGLFEAWPLLSGPTLTLTSPENGLASTTGVVTISGRTAHVAALTLNGGALLPNEDGSFSETLAFPRGGSILTITAADRFGHTVTDTRTVFVP